MKKCVWLILFFQSFIGAKAQELILSSSNRIQDKIYIKCFDNLNQGAEIFEKYPSLKSAKLCSIAECLILLEYNLEDVKQAAKSRLRGIATQLFNEGTPVILTSGMNSLSYADEQNENILDDDGKIYISIGDCVMSQDRKYGEEIFNRETLKLINKKRNGT